MSEPIQLPTSIGSLNPLAGTARIQQPEGVKGQDFKSIMLDSLNEVNRLQKEADLGVQRLLEGKTDNVAEVFNAINKAGIAFDLLMEVRNKLTDAFREVQQMRV